ncbi:MAG: hypothetical protein V9G14_04585 [Cypionkella sp.]
MAAYLIRRLLQSVLILLGVSFITYVLLLCAARRSGAPDRWPLGHGGDGREHPARTGLWISPLSCNTAATCAGLIHGDLGRSYLQKSQVAELIAAAPARNACC